MNPFPTGIFFTHPHVSCFSCSFADCTVHNSLHRTSRSYTAIKPNTNFEWRKRPVSPIHLQCDQWFYWILFDYLDNMSLLSLYIMITNMIWSDFILSSDNQFKSLSALINATQFEIIHKRIPIIWHTKCF